MMGRECSPASWQHLQSEDEALARFSIFVTRKSGVSALRVTHFGRGFALHRYPPREHLSHVYVEGGDKGLRWHGIIVVRRCHHGFGEVGSELCDPLS